MLLEVSWWLSQGFRVGHIPGQACAHPAGTQHIFEDDDSVLYMSLHRHDKCDPASIVPRPLYECELA